MTYKPISSLAASACHRAKLNKTIQRTVCKRVTLNTLQSKRELEKDVVNYEIAVN